MKIETPHIGVAEKAAEATAAVAMTPMAEIEELEEEDDDSDITTVSGFAAHNLEKIPDEGDIFEHENLKITITKTDSNRVMEAVVQVFPKPEESEEE